MHDAVLAYVGANIPAEHGRVLEFGSRDLNGSVRPLFADAAVYIGVDNIDGPSVDVEADAATVEVPGLFDVVVCCEVFEHVDDPTALAIVQNAHRHLMDGGTFIATMAGPGRAAHSAIAATGLMPGEFYRNVDEPTLRAWLSAAGFVDISIDIAGRDIRCTARKESA